jgi:hypothetical protein
MKKRIWLKVLGIVGIISLMAGLGLFEVFPAFADGTPPTPTVITNAATYITKVGTVSAVFNGSYTIGASKVYVWFEYGLTTSYGNKTTAVAKTVSGTFSATSLTNLTPGVTYDYRADLKYGSTTITGSNQTITAGSSGGGSSGLTEYDGVYVDSVNGESIADGGTGTPNNPVSNMTEAFTLATEYKVGTIYIDDYSHNLELTSDIPALTTPLCIKGRDCLIDAININGKLTNGTLFENLELDGDTADYIQAENCYIGLSDGSIGNWDNCSTRNVSLEGYQVDCLTGDDSSNPSIVDCTGTDSSFIGSGFIKVVNCGPGIECNIDGIGGLSVEIDSSCTAGIINLSGDITLTDNSDGTTVVNNTLQNAIANAP